MTPAPPAPERPGGEPVHAIDEHGRRVQAMFSDIAGGYDLANRLMSLGTDARWRRRAVAGLCPFDAEEEPRVLDLCAGTLDSALRIHHRFPGARIVAGDFSAGMLERGRRRLRGAARDRISTVPMDAHAIPGPAAAFDAVFVAFGIRNLSDPPRALGEIARVLRPGGRLTVLEFFRPRTPATRLFHGVYNRTILPIVGWACTGNLGAYLYLPRSVRAFASIEEFSQLLQDHGFDSVEQESLTLGVAAIVRATRRTEAA